MNPQTPNPNSHHFLLLLLPHKKQGNHQFGINLTLLLECLNIFGTSSGNQIALQISYAGEGHPVLLQMVDGDGVCARARDCVRVFVRVLSKCPPLASLFYIF